MIDNVMNYIKRLIRLETFFLLILVGLVGGIYVPNFILEEQLSSKQRHRSMEQTINTQLDLYERLTKRRPKTMTRSGWELETGPDIKYYFPKGVPGQCPNGKAWEIDEQTGYLKPHPDHS